MFRFLSRAQRPVAAAVRTLRTARPASAGAPHPSEGFLSGSSSVYMDEMYVAWKKNPASVHKSWDVFFRNVDAGAPPGSAFSPPPSLQPSVAFGGAPSAAGASSAGDAAAAARDATRLVHLIRAFQVRGHEHAKLDPLGLVKPPALPELDPATYGFTEADLDRVIHLGGGEQIAGIMDEKSTTVRAVVDRLRRWYCGSVGAEYMHILSREKCNWVRQRIEADPAPLDAAAHLQIYERLSYATNFEAVLAQKFNTAKRFGLEGCESLIPGMKTLIDTAVGLGVQNIVMGMPHRGRLNVLCNVIRKPMELIFKEFQGQNVDIDKFMENIKADDWSSSGDVKYHLGTSYKRTYPDGRTVHLSLLANPSHLEAVDPCVIGKTHAKMHYSGDTKGERNLPILLHGDAAFAGQGVVYETMQFGKLEHYHTGGTIHLICNNQIGFTTDPSSSRSTRYSSDLAKAFEAPVFHVNADDPEAVTRVFKIAAEYRQAFHSDVVVDLIGYRRYGHNELDQPMFTQPVMYSVVAKQPTCLKLYGESLAARGIVAAEKLKAISSGVDAVFEAAFEASKSYKVPTDTWLSSRWKGFKSPSQYARIRKTGVDAKVLAKVGEKLVAVPASIQLHRQIAKIIEAKAETLKTGKDIDWSTAEALAFGTLLLEGNHVRISGQDVERGTFSHRHAVLHDQRSAAVHVPLNTLDPGKQAAFVAANSHLSEFGVLGFELGYSLENPNALCIWEAQFGDFVNGAQTIIDQFISSGEAKWLRQSGLVMLLPHGYDGQGPEHSSCRIERFLQMSDEDPDEVPTMEENQRMQIQRANWQIVNCSTPANYYHVLRRQVHRDFRKPLVIMSPKNLLRHKECVSTIADMSEGTKFTRVYGETSAAIQGAPEKVRRVVMCTGKVYYDLLAQRTAANISDVALVRIEQISPFPFDKVAEQMTHFKNAELVWCQEEPKNMGAWYYVQDRIMTATRVLNGLEVRPAYVGRDTQASPAVGYGSVHSREQLALVNLAMSKEVSAYGHGIGTPHPKQRAKKAPKS